MKRSEGSESWPVMATDKSEPKSILIERREIIGVVHPGDGPETMVHAALHKAAEFVATEAETYANSDSMDDRGPFHCRVEFTYAHDRYTVGVNADDER